MKKKTVALVLAGIVVVTALGAGLYFGTDILTAELPEETVVETENPLALDGDTADREVSNGDTVPNSNIVLDDTVEGLENIQLEIADQNNTEKANGTGEYAPIETSFDLSYEQQVAEEMGTSAPTEVITMYANTKCNIRETPSTSAPVVGKLVKGDEVKVSNVGEWNEVVLDDGTKGYVRADLLSDTKPVENTPVATTEPAGESASTAGNENAGGNASNAGTAGNGGDGASAGTENAGSNVPTAGETGNNGETAPSAETADPTIGKTGGSAYTEEQTQALIQQMLNDGATMGGDYTGNNGTISVDPNKETSIDTSNVTLH